MLVFPAGSMVECDTLIIKDDETVENIEEFTLALEEFVPNPRAKRQTQGSRRRTSTGSTLRVAILDNDGAFYFMLCSLSHPKHMLST